MNDKQVKYLSHTRPQEYSIREWAAIGIDAKGASAEKMDNVWTRSVLQPLKDSSEQIKKEAYARLSRTERNERLAIFNDVINNINHAYAIKPYVAQEKVAVARWQCNAVCKDLEFNSNNPCSCTNSVDTASGNKKRLFESTIHRTLDTKTRPVQDILSTFNKAATQTPNIRPWKLSTGTIVDEKLILYAQSLKGEAAVHSFIFDTGDQIIMGLFTTEEQNEILKERRDILTNDLHLSKYLASFACDTFDELRFRLETNDAGSLKALEELPEDDRDRLLQGRRWIYKTILEMADLMEGRAINGYGSRSNSERWYEIHVWKMLDNYALNNKTIELARGENCSTASSFRKNSFGRTPGVRKKMGRRFDGIFRARLNRIELGGIELGPQEQEDNSTKSVDDGLKLRKLLKDQFDYAFNLKSNSKKEDIEMLGLQLLGRYMQVVSLDWVGGLFLRFRREDSTLLPASVGQFNELLIGMAKIMLFFDRMDINITKLNPPRTTPIIDDIFKPPRSPPHLSQGPPTAASP